MMCRPLLSNLSNDTFLDRLNTAVALNTRTWVQHNGCGGKVISDVQISWNYFLQAPECVRICTWRVRYDVSGTLLSTLLIDTVLGVVNAPEVVNTRKCVWQYGCWHEVIGDSQMSWNYFLQTPECVRICTWRVRHDVWYGCSQTCVMTLFSMDWTQLWLLIHQTVCRITGVGMKLSATPKFHETGPRMCAHMHMARQIWWRTLRPNLYNDTVLEVVAQLRL
jgi:hypothetical protein